MLNEYFENFLNNDLYNLEELKGIVKNQDVEFCYNHIFNIGIYKPGHIYKILTKLEVDSGCIDDKIHNFISHHLNPLSPSNKNNNLDLKISYEKSVFCGGLIQTPKPKYSLKKDISNFLSSIRVSSFIKENFIHNGFESMEYIYLQMFSKSPLTSEILKNELHIYDEMTRGIILFQLKKGKFILFILFRYVLD